MNENIKLIRKLAWEEVFIFWYENEGKRANWNKLAEERGFASWADWRLKGYADRFKCREADWGLYEVANPAKVVSEFCGGPFRTWITKYYNGKKTKSFGELVEQDEIINNKTIRSLMGNFPINQIITCLELSDGNFYTIEGMHRCCTLALMNKEKIPGPTSLYFAIGKSMLKELPLAGNVG
jgi:hypothetical protein